MLKLMLFQSAFYLPFTSSIRILIELFLIYVMAVVISYLFLHNIKLTFVIAPFISLILSATYIIPSEVSLYTVLICAIFIYSEVRKGQQNGGMSVSENS